jgi:hypothetical protein
MTYKYHRFSNCVPQNQVFTRAGTEAETYIISIEIVFDIQNNTSTACFYGCDARSLTLREEHKSMCLKTKRSGKYLELTRMKRAI